MLESALASVGNYVDGVSKRAVGIWKFPIVVSTADACPIRNVINYGYR